MTNLYPREVRCGICGTQRTTMHIVSTMSFGSDLDTRPYEPFSTLSHLVRRCPECGYCASDISKTYPWSKALVANEEYKNQLNDPTYPGLANAFLCKAIIDREAKDYAAATWSLIRAAWACDPIRTNPNEPLPIVKGGFHKYPPFVRGGSLLIPSYYRYIIQAMMCRRKAAEMLVLAEKEHQQVARKPGISTVILVDLLRRSGQPDQAQKAITERRVEIEDDEILRILDFEASLIEKGDLNIYTIAYALGK